MGEQLVIVVCACVNRSPDSDVLMQFCDIYICVLAASIYGMATSSSIVFLDIDSAIAEALSSLKLGDLTLKPEQVKAIKLLFQGHDVFVWFPTGYAKFLLYQVTSYLWLIGF